MKKINYLLLAFFAISLTMVSCKKDDPEELVECVSPNDLVAEVGIHKVDFSWTDLNSATTQDWSIQYGENDFSLGDGIIVDNISNSFYTLDDLNADTAYCYYVKANCDSENSSSWQGPKCFTTLFEGPPFTIRVDGEELVNNAVKTYNTLGEDANMELAITNNTNEDINLRMALVSKTAPDTANALVCFDVCYPQIIDRTIYPLNASYRLAAGETSEPGKAHVQYNDASFGSVEYIFEVFQVDENLVKKEDGVTFTYKYDAP